MMGEDQENIADGLVDAVSAGAFSSSAFCIASTTKAPKAAAKKRFEAHAAQALFRLRYRAGAIIQAFR
jgi:hypothetical protein